MSLVARFPRGADRQCAYVFWSSLRKPSVWCPSCRNDISKSYALTGLVPTVYPAHIGALENGSVMETKSADRRRRPRTELSQVVRIRPLDSTLPLDSCKTFNVSQHGMYLSTTASHYCPGMNVYVTSDFQPSNAVAGVVVRVDDLEDGRWGVAIQIYSPSSFSVQ
jgi:hypothetical protein